MLTKTTVAITIIGIAVAALLVLKQPCNAFFCPPGPCYSSAYCIDCICVSQGGQANGICVGVRSIPDGWRVLE